MIKATFSINVAYDTDEPQQVAEQSLIIHEQIAYLLSNGFTEGQPGSKARVGFCELQSPSIERVS